VQFVLEQAENQKRSGGCEAYFSEKLHVFFVANLMFLAQKA